MSGPRFTAEELNAGIVAALRAGDMVAAAEMIEALGVVDPRQAAVIVAAIDLLAGQS